MGEIWKDIEGYEGFYQISNLGRVKSLGRWIYSVSRGGNPFKRWQKEKILAHYVKPDGHLLVTLCKKTITKTRQIHILVAEHFIPNPENKTDVHHIDGNPENNIVYNLMWVTKKQHADLHPEIIKKANKASAKALSIPVRQYTKNGKFVAEYPSAIEAERQTGIYQTHICQCCNNKRKSTGGFIWKYVDDI